MTFSTSWASPGKLRNRLVGWVARLPARVQTKLLIAFLTIVGLLIVLGAVGLQVVNGINSRTEELIKLQRKIAAYHQVQHDTTNQLYNISTALLLQDDKMLDAALRQLSQFGYDLDRMEFIAKGEADLLAGVRKDYDRFTQFVTQSVQLIRSGRTAEARSLQADQVVPIADHLERLTNQLVNIAEADMVSAIDASGRTYRTSRATVVAFALASTLLALGLGYFISWSLVEPVKNIEVRLRQIAGGEFEGRVDVVNRDELGVLAANVNQTSEKLGSLYREIEARNHELSEALEQQTATGAILRVIAASPTDIQPVLNAVAESAARLCEAFDCVILLKDGESLSVKAHYGSIALDLDKWPIERGYVSGRAFLDRQPAHLQNATEDSGDFPEGRAMAARLGYRTNLAVPLLREGEAIGALSIARTEARPFSPERIELLTTFADQAVIAIENVRLFEEVQARTLDLSEALQQQTATADVLKVISRSTFDLRLVLDTLTESAAQLCGADMAGICQREGTGFYYASSFGFPDDWLDYTKARRLDTGRGSIVGRVLLSGVIEQVADVLTDPEYTFLEPQRKAGFRTFLGVPLTREGKPIGVLVVARRTVAPFNAKQIDLVRTFADQAVIAIENVRLFEEVQKRTGELSEALQQQTATAEVLQVISRATFDLQTVLDTLVLSVARLCEADHAWLFRRDGEEYRWAASYGFSHEQHEDLKGILLQQRTVPGRGSIMGRVLLEGKTVHVTDVQADPEYQWRELQQAGQYHTALGVPLLREGEPIGVISVTRSEIRPFTPRQIDLMTTFADQAVIAIENVRLFEEVQARTRQLQDSLDYQTATSNVLNVISRSPTELQPVLDVIIETAVRLCEADCGTIARRQGGQFIRSGEYGFTPEFSALMRRNPVEMTRGSITGRTLVEAKVVHILDAMTDPEYTWAEALELGDIHTGLGMPLLRDGIAIGAIALVRHTVRPFTTKQIELVTTFADQAVIAIENARLFEEVQQRNRELSEALEQQTATSEILRVIAASPTYVQPVLDAVAESAAKLCEAYDAVIFLSEGDRILVKAHHGPIAVTYDELPIERGLVSGRAFLDRKPVHVHDVLQAGDEFPTSRDFSHLQGQRTILSVPLLREGEAIGAIAVRRSEVRPFNQKQIGLLTTFADQAVIAIENVRLFEEVQARNRELSEALEQQTATSAILRVIAGSPTDVQPVLNAVAESAAKLCDAYDAIILLKDGESLAISSHHGPILIDVAKIPIGRGWVTGRAFADRKPVHVHDLAAAVDEFPAGHAAALRQGHRTILAVPLLREDEAIGALVIRRLEMRPFSDKQIDLLTTFADQAVIAIENVRLFQEVQKRTAELARSVEEMKALGEVSQAVNSTLDIKTVLKTIVAKAVQLSGTEAGAIYVYSKTADRFRLRATYGMSDELIAAITGQPIGLNDPGIGEAARRRAPVQAPDLMKDLVSPTQKIVLDSGYRAVLIVPLLGPNKIVGALVVRRRTPGVFPEETVHLLETFAAQSVLAIQNARLFNEIEENGRQLEIASRHKSQFLANMSHELRTPLNSVLGFTEMLSDGLYGELPEKAKIALVRVQANGKHLLGLINDVLDLSKIEAGELKLSLEDYSAGQVVKTVEAAVEPLARAKGLKLSAKIGRNLPLGRGDERRLTQVLLNLAGNAVKFAEAGFVEITAAARNGRFEFTVKDSGPGIAPEHQARIFEEFHQVDDSSTRRKGGTGLGLAISKRIVEMHGGEIGVESAINSGSTFRVTIPVRVEERLRAI